MPFKFNPFSGNFDQTGSGGGGGASYIDGEVATYSDLPLDGTAALNSAWLVREASGIWPVSRKQAGIYIRTATAGSSRDADYTYAGTMPDVFSDAVLTIYDEASTTRTGQFNLGNITAGQNRVLTWPDGNGTIARTSDIPSTFAASAITSGTFDNARINFAAPSNIGTTTPAEINGTTIRTTQGIQAGVIGSYLSLFGSNVRMGSDQVISWNSLASQPSGAFADTVLARDAANVLALRNGANANTFRLYNTFTDASNHERGFMRWSSNVLQIGTEKAGTGSARNVELQRDGTTVVTLGGSGEFRLTSTGQLAFASRGAILMSADGVMWLSNNAGTDFGRLAFGGTTNSFPALKRSSTSLQVRLADDSGYTVLDAQLRAQGTAPATSGATGTAGDIRYDADYIYVCTAANTWKRAAIATW